MRKYIFIIGGIIILTVISFIFFMEWMNTSNANYVRKLIQKENNKSSMVFNENGERKIDVRSSEMMSLASTVKIMVAMEYAFQVSEGKMDGDESISLGEIKKYYIPKLDGGAHEAWISYAEENDFITNDSVPLREVARGMIAFSSNANTEFLMKKIGIEEIEARMNEVGIKDHSPLYYFESATFIPYEIKEQEYEDTTMKAAKKKIIARMKDMEDEEWVALSSTINEKLTSDAQYQEKANVLDWWDKDFDKLYSEKFIKSTTSEYANLMRKINNKEFPTDVQEEMEYLLGMIMENPENQKWLERAGKKGGSTRFILTDAMFAEDKEGNKFELTIFFNDLNWYESQKLMSGLNEFELRLLKDESFRKTVYEALN